MHHGDRQMHPASVDWLAAMEWLWDALHRGDNTPNQARLAVAVAGEALPEKGVLYSLLSKLEVIIG